MEKWKKCKIKIYFFFFFFRILCETVKEMVTKVGKAYEERAENTDDCDSMSVKVSLKIPSCMFKDQTCISLLRVLLLLCVPVFPASVPS